MRLVLLAVLALALVGCASFSDPVTGKNIGRCWGNFDYERSYPVIVEGQVVGTETVSIKRTINTKETLAEICGLVAAIAVIALPLLL